MEHKRIYEFNNEFYVDLKNIVGIEHKKEKFQIEWVYKSGEIHYLKIPEKEIEKKWKDFKTSWLYYKNNIHTSSLEQ
jgi:glucan-binding YG repeat protein